MKVEFVFHSGFTAFLCGMVVFLWFCVHVLQTGCVWWRWTGLKWRFAFATMPSVKEIIRR